MGDLNEWFLWGRPLRHLHRYFDKTPALATFPAGCRCSRSIASGRIRVHILKNLAVHKSALARMASDHLPLVATLEV